MQNGLTHIRRFHPLLRGLFVLYLASTLLLVAGHQHPAGLQGHDCSLCAAAHTPATAVPAIHHETAPVSTGTLLTIPSTLDWDSEPLGTTRSRAPPLA